MGGLDFCANFCWCVGVAGIGFLGMLAIQVLCDNEFLIRGNADRKTSLFVHLVLAMIVL